MRKEEMDRIWESEVQPHIMFLEQKHRRTLTVHAILHIFILAISVFVFIKLIIPFLNIQPDKDFYAIVLVPNIIFLIYTIIVCSQYSKKIKSFYNVFLNHFNMYHSLNKSMYFSASDIAYSGIFGCTSCTIDDIFTGRYQDIPFEIVETTLKKSRKRLGSRRHYYEQVFDGVMLVINDFVKMQKTTIYCDDNYDEKKVSISQDIKATKLIDELTTITGYKGLLFKDQKIFIFIERPGNSFEVDTFNITKEQFTRVLEELCKFISYLDRLNLKEKYYSRQDSLIISSLLPGKLNFWQTFWTFLLYLFFAFCGVHCTLAIVLGFLGLMNNEMSGLVASLSVIAGIFLASYLLKLKLKSS